MKNIRRVLVPLLFAALFLPSCKDKCDVGDFGITSLQPAANPIGYEIFIEAKGVSASTKVRFDNVEAASVKTAEGGLIVKVPSGIAGTVSLSIEDGECNDSKSFDVLGTYPGNVPVGPTTIIIPQTPASLPTSISNAYTNVFDPNHKLIIQDFEEPLGLIDEGSFENYLNDEMPLLKFNPISGHYDVQANTIFIVIDRTDKPEGYVDTLIGQFVPNLSLTPEAQFTMLLKSSHTGRQLVAFQ
ncbi:MAG TPA: hypothetical protein PLO67_13390 [Saprospiraceae bacterium]|nr:hypothetical protein [Saprospiraceae bacterium]